MIDNEAEKEAERLWREFVGLTTDPRLVEHKDRFVSCVADALRAYINESNEVRNRVHEESGKRELAECG